MKILVVEDDAKIAVGVREGLDDVGYNSRRLRR